MRLLRQTDIHCDAGGKKILQTVADDLMHHSLRALVSTHMETGLRKAETTSKTKIMTLKDMTRANLTWSIDGIYVTEPSRRQLESLVPGRDFALLKPPHLEVRSVGSSVGEPAHIPHLPSRAGV